MVSRALLCATILAAVVCLSSATPTDPQHMDVEGLPVYLLYKKKDHHNRVFVHKIGEAHDVEKNLGTARYNMSNHALGWDYLEVNATDGLPDDDGRGPAYVSGFAEGFLTFESIAAQNLPHKVESVKRKSDSWEFLMKHYDDVRTNTLAANNQHQFTSERERTFWEGMKVMFEQMEGLADGFNDAMDKVTHDHRKLTTLDVYIWGFWNELTDLYRTVEEEKKHKKMTSSNSRRFTPSGLNVNNASGHDASDVYAKLHCSAVVRMTPNDLFVGHATWSSYSWMSWRTYKVIQFARSHRTETKQSPVRVAYSGYPGMVVSSDDWYVTDAGLSVIETSDEVFNRSLYRAALPSGSVSEFLRVMVATYYATTSREWIELYSMHNSGTYNNQYMVVDYKRFHPAQTPDGVPTLEDGAFWVAEQLPGLIHSEDKTSELRQRGYWSSYNIPYFTNVYDSSGYAQQEAEFGEFWSFTNYSRAQIFRRDTPSATTLADVQRLLRYNDYQNDPFSTIKNCEGTTNGHCDPARNPYLSIAARGDLAPSAGADKLGPLHADLSRGPYGSVDAKVSTWSTHKRLGGYAISGPTNDQQPTFDYRETPWNGWRPSFSPVRFDFPWLEIFPTN